MVFAEDNEENIKDGTKENIIIVKQGEEENKNNDKKTEEQTEKQKDEIKVADALKNAKKSEEQGDSSNIKGKDEVGIEEKSNKNSDYKEDKVIDNEKDNQEKEVLRLPPIGEKAEGKTSSNNGTKGVIEVDKKSEGLDKNSPLNLQNIEKLSDDTNVLQAVEHNNSKSEDKLTPLVKIVDDKKIIKIDADKQKDKKKKDKTKKVGTLFTIFDKDKALKFSYNTNNSKNYGFLENAEELKVIRQLIVEQKDSEIKKRRLEEERKKESMTATAGKIKSGNSSIVNSIREAGGIKRILYLYSLVYFNDQDWNIKVNKQIIPYKDKDNLKNDVVSILKVNKGSVVFVMNDTDDEMIKKVNKLIEKKVPYSHSYFIVKQKHRTYVAFKLYIGQKIDLETMKIEG